MAIALDTNIPRPVLAGDRRAITLTPLLDGYNASDGLVVCAPVYAELLAGPATTVAELDAFLAATDIVVDFNLSPDVWRGAGLAFHAYAERRIAARDMWPRRILADFVIGMHALLGATALMTLDRAGFAPNFPTLALIVPVLSSPSTTDAP